MSAPVFLAEPAELRDARTGTDVVLGGDEGRHAVNVRRIRPGETVDLADGAGRRVRGQVAAAAAGELRVTVDDVHDEPAPTVRLVLVQALAKGGRDEQAVEMATELGADAVIPWQSRRCVSVWQGAKAAKGRARWQAVARSAAKQSRRAWLPEVEPLVIGADLVDRARSVVAAGGAVVVLHEEATVPLAAATLPAGSGDAAQVLVVVGPEGGLAPEEVAALEEVGAAVVLLGPHVLRTSTAGPVAIASLAQRLGRWG
ncbi:16S rRNA (uracil(1498)-N(3))-methyltransferase [Georgenia sunbinii]|uniref:16S rRNA (uracil(1498)-N(3))-methyltransferase n=1 Tax=Georgenia sunbinii TaxID=3117728 RepID=UPI002F25FD8C